MGGESLGSKILGVMVHVLRIVLPWIVKNLETCTEQWIWKMSSHVTKDFWLEITWSRFQVKSFARIALSTLGRV